jgi:Rad3-related DNA helicase
MHVQMEFCNVIIYSYHYLLDPKIAERVSKDLSKDCIVVFDEAHNIDNVCIESLSTDITEDSLRRATKGAQNLENKINEMRDSDQQKLQDEYEKLVEGLRGADDGRQEDSFMANPSTSSSAAWNWSIMLTAMLSSSRRPAQGGHTRQHSESRALCCVPPEIHRISQGQWSRPYFLLACC